MGPVCLWGLLICEICLIMVPDYFGCLLVYSPTTETAQTAYKTTPDHNGVKETRNIKNTHKKLMDVESRSE